MARLIVFYNGTIVQELHPTKAAKISAEIAARVTEPRK